MAYSPCQALLIMSNQREIGEISNQYGMLYIKEEKGRFYWCIEDCFGMFWDEIPKFLYDTLVRYDEERKQGLHNYENK